MLDVGAYLSVNRKSHNFHIILLWEYPVDAGEMQILEGICGGFTFRKLAGGIIVLPGTARGGRSPQLFTTRSGDVSWHHSLRWV